jgi:predicted  nucleic acid-binding Zn-ribbon protein
MPRGRRRTTTTTPDVSALEQELQALKQRQVELRAQIRRQKQGAGGIRKLQEKLEKQLAGAKWTAEQIKQLQADWDEIGFYRSVEPRQPTPRGRRPRSSQG